MPALPPYIAELRLKGAFRGYSIPIETCLLSSTQDVICIADSEEHHYTVFVDENSVENLTGRALSIYNLEHQPICILQIDNKLISPRSRQKRCDCAILDASKMRFVEFKTNAQGNSVKAVHDTYEQAIEQLGATLHLFIEQEQQVGIALKEARDLSAHICTAIRFPRLPSTQVGYAIQFAMQEGIPLTFGHKMNI